MHEYRIEGHGCWIICSFSLDSLFCLCVAVPAVLRFIKIMILTKILGACHDCFLLATLCYDSIKLGGCDYFLPFSFAYNYIPSSSIVILINIRKQNNQQFGSQNPE